MNLRSKELPEGRPTEELRKMEVAAKKSHVGIGFSHLFSKDEVHVFYPQ